jgi:phage tail P2-like protein
VVSKLSNDIYTVDLLQTLPPSLSQDPDVLAFATVFGRQLQITAGLIRNNIIYARIDELPEEVLDVLAYDFKVDWWDSGFTLTEKRATLKNSWRVHRKLGTPYAVERAISAIYPGSRVVEWFEYEGDPFHFKLDIPVDELALDPVKHARVLELVSFYKNSRSVLDVVVYHGSTGTLTIKANAAFVGSHITAGATAIDEGVTEPCGTTPLLLLAEANYLANG